MPNNGQASADANLFANQHFVQMMYAPNRLAIKCHDQVALAQTSAFGGAVLLDRNHEHCGLERQTVIADDPLVNRHVLSGDTDVTTPDFSVFNQPGRYELRRVTADGEA